MATEKKIKFVNNMFYIYKFSISPTEACHRDKQVYDEFWGRSLVPLKPIKDLNSKPEKIS